MYFELCPKAPVNGFLKNCCQIQFTYIIYITYIIYAINTICTRSMSTNLLQNYNIINTGFIAC